MKKTLLGAIAILFGCVGIVMLLNVLYNVGGLLGAKDAASGSKWETALAASLFGALAIFAFLACSRLARLATSQKTDPN